MLVWKSRDHWAEKYFHFFYSSRGFEEMDIGNRRHSSDSRQGPAILQPWILVSKEEKIFLDQLTDQLASELKQLPNKSLKIIGTEQNSNITTSGENVLDIRIRYQDIRLTPRCEWYLRSAEMPRVAQWHFVA